MWCVMSYAVPASWCSFFMCSLYALLNTNDTLRFMGVPQRRCGRHQEPAAGRAEEVVAEGS